MSRKILRYNCFRCVYRRHCSKFETGRTDKRCLISALRSGCILYAVSKDNYKFTTVNALQKPQAYQLLEEHMFLKYLVNVPAPMGVLLGGNGKNAPTPTAVP